MDGLTKSVVLWRQPSIYDSQTGYPPGKCTRLSASATDSTVKLTWSDPDDILTYSGKTIKWEKTIIVRKLNSCPSNINDGTVIVTNTTKNQYQTSPYVDNITNGTSYYYAAFTCSTDGVYSREAVYVIPSIYKTMTVQFTISSSARYGTYMDDAVGMTYGKDSAAVTQWQEFFGYKPCLFKDGHVVGYLNPSNYAQFEDGTTADITSGNAGDVMVEFPRRGIKISKSGSTVTVSMTDDPNAEGFSYNAHRRGSTQKDYFYVGAYLAYISGGMSRSISGVTPVSDISLNEIRRLSEAHGSGYMNVGFYQFVFIQCMYLLQYCGNLDSQTVHGYGNFSSLKNTGSTNTRGLMYGYEYQSISIKLFGIEDFWGNLYWYIDGCHISFGSYRSTILTTTDEFNSYGDGYIAQYSSSSTISGYIQNAHCTNELGFVPTTSTSSSGYFFDYGCIMSALGKSGVSYVGGYYDMSSPFYCGVFTFATDQTPTFGSRKIGGRLCYL